MSWIFIDGKLHGCTVEDLRRWDAAAADAGSTREAVAKKELKAPAAKSKPAAKKDKGED